MVTAGGRLFYIWDEGPTSLIHRPACWRLIARDAFNGALLWKRPIESWITSLYYFRSGPAHLPRRLVAVGEEVYVTLGLEAPVSALDAATGRTLRTYAGSEGAEEIVCHRGVLLVAADTPSQFNRRAPEVWNYWEHRVPGPPDAPKRLLAYRAEDGEALWRREGDRLGYLAPLSLCAEGDRVYYLDDKELHCLDLATGRPKWSAPFPVGGLFLRNYAPTVVAQPEAVVCLSDDRIAAFDPADGHPLWHYDRGALGFASPADLFVIDGLVWTLPGTAAVLDPADRTTRSRAYAQAHYLGEGGTEFWGIDLRSGEVRRRIPKAQVWPGGHHHRCYRNKATSRYLVCSRRGLEFVDLRGDGHVRHWWVRGECQYGLMPAGGMVYVPPDPCRCFNAVKVNGFLALRARSALEQASPEAEEEVLERGPAYPAASPAGLKSRAHVASRTTAARATAPTRPPAPEAGQTKPAGPRPAADRPGGKRTAAADPRASKKPAERRATRRRTQAEPAPWHPPVPPADPAEWPTYRHDITRSGSTPAPLPARVRTAWRVRLGGRLTSPVVADGRLLVARVDGYTLHALEAETGRPLWRFAAGGRIDSPPTLARGLALFGCRDGYLYAVRARDGRLAWRRRVAPAEALIGADGRLESAWPLPGSTLVLDETVYAVAGRSSYLDGGLRVVGLDVETGRLRHQVRLSADAARPGAPGSVGALPDVLISDGSLIAMRHVVLDRALRPQDPARPATLLAMPSLLEDAWFHRETWHLGYPRPVRCTGQAAVNGGLPGQAGGLVGKLIVFDERRAFAVQSPYTFLKHDRSMWPPTHQGHLHQKYARYKPAWFPTGVWLVARPRPGTEGPAWRRDLPLQVRAMVLGGDRLAVAGWMDAVGVAPPEGRPVPGAEKTPAELRVLATGDGRTLSRLALPARPVFDGLIAARGRLYLALADGSVLRLDGAGG